jgi:hypothetical protein
VVPLQLLLKLSPLRLLLQRLLVVLRPPLVPLLLVVLQLLPRRLPKLRLRRLPLVVLPPSLLPRPPRLDVFKFH